MSRSIIPLILLAAIGCGPVKQPPGAPPPPTVSVIHPATTMVQKYYEYNGFLDAVESVNIQARVEGFLDAVHFKEGDEVNVNDPLYTIDPREYKSAVAKAQSDIKRAVADMANATAQIQLAEADLGRLKAVGPSASKSEIDKAEANLAASKAMLDVAAANKSSAEAAERTANLKLSYTDIRAPIPGRISRTLVTPGNLVGQKDATLLTTIVSVKDMYVYFDVPERDLSAYQRLMLKEENAKLRAIPVEVGVGDEEGYPHKGDLNFQENRVETGTGTVRIRGKLPNPLVPPRNIRLLYPGLYAKVRVPAGPEAPRVVIPEEALLTGQEGRFVYVIGAENKVEKRSVTVGQQVWRAGPPGTKPEWSLAGPKDATMPVRSVVAIEKGLSEQDRIIAVGIQLQRVRPGAVVNPEDWQFRGPAAKAAQP